MVRALIEEKILYADKNLGEVNFEQPIYKYYVQEYLDYAKANVSTLVLSQIWQINLDERFAKISVQEIS